MQANREKRNWRSVFRRVMSHYDELKSVQGTNSCGAFYNGLSNEGGKSGLNLRVVRVTPTDFICDVELAAKRALNEEEHRQFTLVYLKKDREIVDYTDSDKTTKYDIQEKLGKMFIARKLYPIVRYFKPKDLR